MSDKNKHIDKIIQQGLKIEETSIDFSANVMDKILASESKKEAALSSLMNKHVLESVSNEFTSNVLAKIEHKTLVDVYTPVFGKKSWFLIGSLVVFIVAYTLLKADGTSQKYGVIGEWLSISFDKVSFNFPSVVISPLFALSIFVLSSLLFLDYFIRNRSFA